jgi:transketolase
VRNVFCRSLLAQAHEEGLVFLTGDLGFKALEPLRDALGTRFINAGVAEQNMVSVAAGLAKLGLKPWVYSIAPFIYARAFEQIRNDVCLHKLPVIMVGNGGGYAYGVMGSTHHALEDYGCLLTLPNIRVCIPAFDEDVSYMVPALVKSEQPVYLRLGVSELPSDFDLPAYRSWRKLLNGMGPTVVVSGPIVGGLLLTAAAAPESNRPSIWVITELPIGRLPELFVDDLNRSRAVIVVEEHASVGGLGQMLALSLAQSGNMPASFSHRSAAGYVSGLYGSQKFHRRESGLDASSIMTAILNQ